MTVAGGPERVSVFCRAVPEGLSKDCEIVVDVNRRRANPETGKLEGRSCRLMFGRLFFLVFVPQER